MRAFGGSDETWPAVMAPGKAVLAGEYGVLFGSSILAMAVDRYVFMRSAEEARERDGEKPAQETDTKNDPLVQCLMEEAARLTTIPASPPLFDAGELYDDRGDRLGLGSSAAKAAALFLGAFLLSRDGLDHAAQKAAVFDAASRAHRLAGGGSGADVAASVFGGAIRFRLALRGASSVFEAGVETDNEVEMVSLPERSMPLLVRGCPPVSTREALARLEERTYRRDDRVAGIVEEVTSTGDVLVAALLDERTEERDLTGAVDASRRALLRLSESLSPEAISGESALFRAGEVASSFGAAVKPSGAGGGDLILVFAPALDPDERGRLASSLDNAGLPVLDVGLDQVGARPIEG